jgi:hypothetical protein
MNGRVPYSAEKRSVERKGGGGVPDEAPASDDLRRCADNRPMSRPACRKSIVTQLTNTALATAVRTRRM